MSPEELERALDEWGRDQGQIAERPTGGAFLGLVRRERVRRHLRGLAVAAGLTLVACVLVTALVRPEPGPDADVEPTGTPAVGWLNRLHSGPDGVVLPESPDWGVAALRVADRARLEIVEELASGL